MRLILIRHGEAHHNREPLIAGPRGDRGLTERGTAQVRLLGRRLAATGEAEECAALLTSPLPRARETAQLLLPFLPIARLSEEPDLEELRVGLADGLTPEAFIARYGPFFDLVAEPERPFAPEGESWTDFSGRVERLLHELARRWAGRTVLAVTHGGFIIAGTRALLAVPAQAGGAQIHPGNTSLTEWRHADGRWHLRRFSDTAHLSFPTPL